ncbi:glycosyltransferase 87 family protein [Yinghuangia sp. YIM S09857]|uniref:glycosyltransferase 87 family protein n=1 Tax=Yinghuangia sp. YIM S09857 TaxID=3436929 RepID=UPI003F53036B
MSALGRGWGRGHSGLRDSDHGDSGLKDSGLKDSGLKDSGLLAGRIVLGVCAAAYALSLGAWVWLVRAHPDTQWLMLDLATMHDAAASLRHGQDRAYTEVFGPFPGPFIYPPIAALVFYVALPLGMTGLKIAMAALSHAAVLAAVWISLGMLGRRRGSGRVAATLGLSAVALWLEPVHKTLMFGQVGLLLMVLVLADCALPDRSRLKGAGIGLATGLKLTPGLFVVYLLLTRRFRAAATAAAVTAATMVVGWAAIPRAARQYWFDSMWVGDDINGVITLAHAINQSLKGVTMRVFETGAAGQAAWLAGAVVAAVGGMAAAREASVRGLELLGVVLCAGVTLFVSPISWQHHWVWAVPVLVLAADLAWRRRDRVLAVGAALYAGLIAAWPMRLDWYGHWDASFPLEPYGLIWLGPHEGGREFRWNAWQFVVGNSLFAVHAALAVAVCGYLWSTRTRRRMRTRAAAVPVARRARRVPYGLARR